MSPTGSRLEREEAEELVEAEAREERGEATGPAAEAEAAEETAKEAVEREEAEDRVEETADDVVGAREEAGDAAVGERGDGAEETGEGSKVAEAGSASEALDTRKGGEELSDEGVELLSGRELAENRREEAGDGVGATGKAADGAGAREKAEDDLEELLDDGLEAGRELGEVLEGRGELSKLGDRL